MKILVFDTETTGLSKFKKVLPVQIDSWPYIVQFSYMMYDKQSIEKVGDDIIKLPPGVVIPEETSKIHGITNEMCETGVDISECLLKFAEYYSQADVIVAHNLSFDLNMITAELIRLIYSGKETHHLVDYSKLLKSLSHPPENKHYCTLQNSIVLCNIKAVNLAGKEYTKFPTLSELHKELFQTIPVNLHNSLNDVVVCLRCYYMLDKKEDILEKNILLKNMYESLVT
jgi:DNA polymerase III epsilon subunit-like protein